MATPLQFAPLENLPATSIGWSPIDFDGIKGGLKLLIEHDLLRKRSSTPDQVRGGLFRGHALEVGLERCGNLAKIGHQEIQRDRRQQSESAEYDEREKLGTSERRDDPIP